MDFLQSEEWRKFQKSTGKRTFFIDSGVFSASVIEHKLPLIGKYFYIPRGPIIKMQNDGVKCEIFFNKLINLAKENNIGWIRIEPANEEVLNVIKKNIKNKIIKAPHDMQPKEIFVIDLTKSEERLLMEMKSKTRYNIKVAEKHNVSVTGKQESKINEKYISEFIRLTKIMAKRQGITPHPEKYYQKMLEIIPGEIMKLYLAEYEGKIIGANIMVFYGKVCTYLHGASDDQYKNLMAPYLLHWQAIRDAKNNGYEKYDFGGIKTGARNNNWSGITRFKLGFSPNTKPTEFLGSYDLVINPARYKIYRIIQGIKSLIK